MLRDLLPVGLEAIHIDIVLGEGLFKSAGRGEHVDNYKVQEGVHASSREEGEHEKGRSPYREGLGPRPHARRGRSSGELDLRGRAPRRTGEDWDPLTCFVTERLPYCYAIFT